MNEWNNMLKSFNMFAILDKAKHDTENIRDLN
jgi:hypothetical protein